MGCGGGDLIRLRFRRVEALAARPASGGDGAGGRGLRRRNTQIVDSGTWTRSRPTSWSGFSGAPSGAPRAGARDHFLVVGRGSWDFLRAPDATSNSLKTYPAIRNATVLTMEASPYHVFDFAVPFPSHYHASSDADVSRWQGRMRRAERRWLWGFAGESWPSSKRTVRSQIMEQCRRSSHLVWLHRPGLNATTCTATSSSNRVMEARDMLTMDPINSFICCPQKLPFLNYKIDASGEFCCTPPVCDNACTMISSDL
ncbi:hypothetical protein ACQ4PT_066625 [Festuca glaucescens]